MMSPAECYRRSHELLAEYSRQAGEVRKALPEMPLEDVPTAMRMLDQFIALAHIYADLATVPWGLYEMAKELES